MMKRIIKYLLCIITLIATQFPISIAAEEIENIGGYSLNEKKSIIYDTVNNQYVLTNITADEVFEAMTSNKDFERSGKPKVLETYSINGERAKNYSQDYNLIAYAVGVQGERVTINFTCNMRMTTVRYNGIDYAQFVKFNLKPQTSLGSGPYVFSVKGECKFKVLNGGASIEVSQILQLQTTKTYSLNANIAAGWGNFGGSVGGQYYFRNQAKTYTVRRNLPLYNIIT